MPILTGSGLNRKKARMEQWNFGRKSLDLSIIPLIQINYEVHLFNNIIFQFPA